MKIFKGRVSYQDGDVVTCNDNPLDPRLDLFNHSPSGLSWGYNGSGPNQLSIAILAEVIGNDEEAKKFKSDYYYEVTSQLPHGENWVLGEDEVWAWLKKHGYDNIPNIESKDITIEPITESEKENIVKVTCKVLGTNQKELAEQIGAAEATVRNWSSGKDVPEWARKSMQLLIDRKNDKEIIDTAKKLFNLLSK